MHGRMIKGISKILFDLFSTEQKNYSAPKVTSFLFVLISHYKTFLRYLEYRDLLEHKLGSIRYITCLNLMEQKTIISN